MSKIEPLIESVALIEVQSLALQEKSAILTPLQAALPNRIAVVGVRLNHPLSVFNRTDELIPAGPNKRGQTAMVAWVTATLADDPCRMRGGRLRCTDFLKIASLPGWKKSPAS